LIQNWAAFFELGEHASGKNLARLVPIRQYEVYAFKTVAFEGGDIVFRNVFKTVLYEIDATLELCQE